MPATGCELIAAERDRQILEERFGATRDDGYENGELVLAGLAYGYAGVPLSRVVEGPDGEEFARYPEDDNGPPDWWPWDVSWWKPSDDPVENLVKAGALIAAEIDRLQRAAREA